MIKLKDLSTTGAVQKLLFDEIMNLRLEVAELKGIDSKALSRVDDVLCKYHQELGKKVVKKIKEYETA
jgi:hypothetical protein